jgi:hypothetical protein
MLFLPVPTALNGDGITHASSLAFEKFAKLYPRLIRTFASRSQRSVGSKEYRSNIGFRDPLSREVMTISLSQSIDALTFACVICAEMEEGNE